MRQKTPISARCCAHVRRQTYRGVNFPEQDLALAERAMERVRDVEGIGYASLAEFVRDALRRRVEAINEAWRSTRHLPDARPPKRKEG